MSPVTDYRKQARAAGFSPVPVEGKAPAARGWQKFADASEGEIESWARFYPRAENTGILTARTPALDIDIKDPDAAAAIERLVRELFEEKGEILPRFGQAPKRAILFRTDAPFKKIKIVFGEPGTPERDCEKLEFMCDGQQLVIDGIHPGTGRPYLWHGGKPGSTKREELPYIHAEEAKELIKACAALLVNEYGYKLIEPKSKRDKQANGEDTEPADWSVDFSSHDSLAAFVMKLIAGGTNPGLVSNLCRAQIEAHVRDPGRKQRRLKELQGMIGTAVAKIEQPQQPKFEPTTLAQAAAAFDKWLVLPDKTPLYAMLGTIAANLLEGDPVWLGIIAPSSSAKTELLNAASHLPYVAAAEVLTPAALLSGTPKRQKIKGATGGLLPQIGDFGILIFKDFGTVLEMRIETRNELLAALCRVFDCEYSRQIGADGGRTLSWIGKAGLLFAATQKYDLYHGVIGTLGDRFLLVRLDPTGGEQFDACFKHDGKAAKAMRAELSAAVGGLFAGLPNPLPEPPPLNDEERAQLKKTVMLAVRLRAGVERDRIKRDLEAVYDPEGPARLTLSLVRLFAGLIVIGLDRSKALAIVQKVALDSCPRFRLKAYRALTSKPQTTRKIATAIELPTATAGRALEELVAHGLAAREESSGANEWKLR